MNTQLKNQLAEDITENRAKTWDNFAGQAMTALILKMPTTPLSKLVITAGQIAQAMMEERAKFMERVYQEVMNRPKIPSDQQQQIASQPI